MRPFATLPALLALLAAACSDVPGPVSSAPEPPPEGFQTELACTATVREGRVSCADDAPEGGSGAFPRLIIGGQGVYVRLRSSGAAYTTSDSIFRVNVTVQNLMTQAFGTPDGTTDTGLRVFFSEGPDVTAGTGSVAVDNEDGSDTFLSAMTPYFAYGGVLYTNKVSTAKTWRFKVGPQVQTFSFKVLVQGQLPHPGSLRLFRSEISLGPIYDIWGPSASDVFAVGSGIILRYTGGAWVRDEVSPFSKLTAVWGTSASDVYAADEWSILHWNGTQWSEMDTDHLCMYFDLIGHDEWFACPEFRDVWASGPGDVWAVGDTEVGLFHGDGYERMDYRGVIAHYDGTQWVADTVADDPLWGVWGSAANDVWAVGDYNSMLHYDGTAWKYRYFPRRPETIHFNSVWGLSATNVYAPYVGYFESGVLHYDGVEWRPMPGLPADDHYYSPWYTSVWGTAPDNLFVGGSAETYLAESPGIMHWDGRTWTAMNRGSYVTALWGFGPNDVLASMGAVHRGTR
jgi:hypothetical protein